ncbi:MAG: hydroxyacid dehydrogenase [Candidatus Wolfebacteria bacterium]|nr:hydroxyacid dehydrogenase [Candidatus Wolfebacteria bacterium]
MKIQFFEIEPWEAEYINSKFSAEGGSSSGGQIPNFQLIFTNEKLNKDSLPQTRDFDAVSVFVGSKLDAETIGQFPNLKLITTRSTGFDHIDLAATKEKGIKIGYVPGYGDNTVAEYAFGLMLSLSRKIFEGADRLKETGSFNFDGLRGFDLMGKTIGVIGTGRIGKYAIKIAKGFGMNIVAFDAFPNEGLAKEMDFKYLPLEELLGTSDVITLHVPYLPATHHLINSQNIGKIKKGALLINTSRGAVIETDALVKALNDGILSGAGLDVLEEEGILQEERQIILGGHLEEHNLKTVLEDHVLIDMPNVLITPHNAFNTKEAIQRILDADIENVKSFIEKGEVKYSVPFQP